MKPLTNQDAFEAHCLKNRVLRQSGSRFLDRRLKMIGWFMIGIFCILLLSCEIWILKNMYCEDDIHVFNGAWYRVSDFGSSHRKFMVRNCKGGKARFCTARQEKELR